MAYDSELLLKNKSGGPLPCQCLWIMTLFCSHHSSLDTFMLWYDWLFIFFLNKKWQWLVACFVPNFIFRWFFFFLLWYQENLTQLGEAKAKFCHESTRFRCSFLELKVLDCFCFTISHWCAGQYYYSAVLVGHLLISSFIYSLFSILGLL
jgi:hypothetical protein